MAWSSWAPLSSSAVAALAPFSLATTSRLLLPLLLSFSFSFCCCPSSLPLPPPLPLSLSPPLLNDSRIRFIVRLLSSAPPPTTPKAAAISWCSCSMALAKLTPCRNSIASTCLVTNPSHGTPGSTTLRIKPSPTAPSPQASTGDGGTEKDDADDDDDDFSACSFSLSFMNPFAFALAAHSLKLLASTRKSSSPSCRFLNP
mmetsp:Transcript_12542/g.25528  ORF Transcript_12542/g.25528 Transcript_12542/m.25528 type:complete len:200 (+) Transcript_12542:1110-1709(+)